MKFHPLLMILTNIYDVLSNSSTFVRNRKQLVVLHTIVLESLSAGKTTYLSYKQNLQNKVDIHVASTTSGFLKTFTNIRTIQRK